LKRTHLWRVTLGPLTFGLMLLAGCHTDMWVQPYQKRYRANGLFPDGQGMRPLPPGAVGRSTTVGQLWQPTTAAHDENRRNNPFYTDLQGGRLVTALPTEALAQFGNDPGLMLRRGQERFNIYCSPCHSRVGDGNGMIAQRGFALRRQPGNYHTARLRELPDGHFFDVITNGFGTMYSYASRIEPRDRWAIVAWIRVLQRSQNASPADLPPGVNLTLPPNLPATGSPTPVPPANGATPTSPETGQILSPAETGPAPAPPDSGQNAGAPGVGQNPNVPETGQSSSVPPHPVTQPVPVRPPTTSGHTDIPGGKP